MTNIAKQQASVFYMGLHDALNRRKWKWLKYPQMSVYKNGYYAGIKRRKRLDNNMNCQQALEKANINSDNATEGDWVLVKGLTENRPFVPCFFASELLYGGDGELYVDTCGGIMDSNQIIEITRLGVTNG